MCESCIKTIKKWVQINNAKSVYNSFLVNSPTLIWIGPRLTFLRACLSFPPCEKSSLSLLINRKEFLVLKALKRRVYHCDRDKVHERIMEANVTQGAGSFVHRSAERLIESDRRQSPGPEDRGGTACSSRKSLLIKGVRRALKE